MTSNSKKPIFPAVQAIQAIQAIYNERGGAAVILLAILLALGLSFFAASNHFVMTERGIKVYSKQYLTFSETYVDMRHVGIDDLARHEPVVKVMVKNGDTVLGVVNE